MTTAITFINQAQYEFVTEFLRQLKASGFLITTKPKQLTVQTNNRVINRLLERLAVTNSTVLPYFDKQQDQWFLVGQDRRILDQTLSRIAPFIIPSYAEFSGNGGLAQLVPFIPHKDKLNQLGQQLYTLGYYSWLSPATYRSTILDRLNIWLELEAKQPAIPLPEKHNYHDLYQIFEQALAASNWSKANKVLHEMQRLNLITAENLQFLRIQWLAQQQKWQEIWEHPDFATLAKLRMPRDVRAAMLTAFHHTMLLPLERTEEWETAFTVFQEARVHLGTLLVGRFGLAQAPVLRVFGYQALFDGDHTTISQLQADAPDAETRRCLNALEKLLPPIADDKPLVTDPLRQVLLELRAGNYDQAIALIKSIEDIVERVLLAIEVAYHSNDDDLAQEAWAIYQRLSPEQKDALTKDHRYVSLYLDFLRERNVAQPNAIWSSEEAKARETALNGVFTVEYRLRRLIETRYAEKFGDDWELHIKPELREKWEVAKNKDEKTFAQYGMSQSSLLDYTYLGDLVGLINTQWSLFQDIFGAGKAAKREFTRKTEAIIRVRNPLAHNRTVPINELKRADVYCTDLLIELEVARE